MSKNAGLDRWYGVLTGFGRQVRQKIKKFHKFSQGVSLGGNFLWDCGLSDFRGREPKKSKNQPKLKIFRFFKIGPNVKIWVSGVQFRLKKAFFFAKNKILTFSASQLARAWARAPGGT